MRSRNHCYRGKVISITHFECVFVALVIQFANRVRHIILSPVVCVAVPCIILSPVVCVAVPCIILSPVVCVAVPCIILSPVACVVVPCIILSPVACVAVPCVSTLLHKRHDFCKTLLRVKCVFGCSL